MLGHPNALADAEVLHVLSTTVRKDLDQIVGTYLALPTHLRDRALPAATAPPATSCSTSWACSTAT